MEIINQLLTAGLTSYETPNLSSYHDTERTHIVLVGGFNPSEKYEFVSWDDDIPIYMEK